MPPQRQAGSRLPIVVAVALSLLTVPGCRRKTVARAPSEVSPPVVSGARAETGLASWYGDPYHGRRTASGEVFDKMKFTAAHRTLAFDSWVRVTNLENNRFTTVRINDRGPFIEGRILDLSQAAARALDMLGVGTALVRLELVQSPEGKSGSAGGTSPGRFAVQVGAFLVRENAERLRSTLAQDFGDIFIEAYDAPDGRYYRVRVGRTTEEEAHRLAQRLRQQGVASQALVVRLD